MANIIRSPKHGRDWTKNDLRAFNIEVVSENVATFFENADLPPPNISPSILAHETYPAAGLPTDDRLFFDLLDEVMHPCPVEKSAVDDFAVHLLRLLGYAEPNRYFVTQKDIPLHMCSDYTYTKPNVCVVDQTSRSVRLLLQEDEGCLEGNDPEPQLIAGAIAAFQSHNFHLYSLGLPTAITAVIPGITMVGTAPTFYKISVNTTLVEAVRLGEYPVQTTTVRKLIPPVQKLWHFHQEGMQPLDNRAVILSCFEAFKQFLSAGSGELEGQWMEKISEGIAGSPLFFP